MEPCGQGWCWRRPARSPPSSSPATHRDFDVIEGMVGIALIAAVVVAMVLLSWRRGR
ncbi:hypothetical protein [Dankookia sp. P2]|uniref:hypothetical protein n=1 Tax=Dankookia sp. P2 TaxID=3423955 RepID=UPI003D66BB08